MAHKNPVEGKRRKNSIENEFEYFEKYEQYLAMHLPVPFNGLKFWKLLQENIL